MVVLQILGLVHPAGPGRQPAPSIAAQRTVLAGQGQASAESGDYFEVVAGSHFGVERIGLGLDAHRISEFPCSLGGLPV